jgi:hypothetical protein
MFDIKTNKHEIISFFENHPLTKRSENSDFISEITYIDKGFISFHNIGFDSYLSAILTDFLRYKFLDAGKSFTFETVMSSPNKIEILKKAQEEGYRTYLLLCCNRRPTYQPLTNWA